MAVGRSIVPPVVQVIAEIMDKFPHREWIKHYQAATGKGYEAAKKEWGRKKHLAVQLNDARGKSLESCPFVSDPVAAPTGEGTKRQPSATRDSTSGETAKELSAIESMRGARNAKRSVIS